MSLHIQKAQLLLEQSRHDLAEKELRLALAESPDHPIAHALLAMTLVELKRFDEATTAAQESIALAPDLDFCHYALASVLLGRNRYPEAEQAIREAIRLDTEDPDYHSTLAHILTTQKQWEPALQSVETALEIHAEHVDAANLRVFLLTQLGRKEEVGAAIEGTLRRSPDNSTTHANHGWALLHQNKPKEAMTHFRESLRLDPQNDWARQGIVEAMKAHNFFYRQLLRYFLAMSRLSDRAQWGVILGAWILIRVIRSVSQSYPPSAPFLQPILYLYLAFVFFSWTGPTLANLLLRLHPFGRLALSREDTVASNWVGGALVGGLVSAAIYGIMAIGTTPPHGLLLLASVCVVLVIPIAGTFNCDPGWPRRTYAVITCALGLTGAGGAFLHMAGSPDLGTTLWLVAFVGTLLSTWLGGLLTSVTVKH